MYTTYHLNSPTEITSELIEAIKLTFKNKSIILTIQEEIDTTSFLNHSKTNNMQLEKSLKQDRQGEHILVKFEDL